MEYSMPPVEGIDWEKAHQYMPEKEVLLDVLREFVTSCDEQIERLVSFMRALETSATDDGFTAYRIQAHAMKAGLRSLGSDLFDMALSLEEAGRDHSLTVISERTGPFTEEYRGLAERLEPLAGKAEGKSAFDDALFLDKLKVLEEAMDSFDIGTLRDAIKEIRNMQAPDKYFRGLENLETAVRDLDSDGVRTSCESLRELAREGA